MSSSLASGGGSRMQQNEDDEDGAPRFNIGEFNTHLQGNGKLFSGKGSSASTVNGQLSALHHYNVMMKYLCPNRSQMRKVLSR